MSQLRKHIVFSNKVLKRAAKWSEKLRHLGKDVWIDKRVEFMRFPENISIDDEVVVKEGARICSCNENAQITVGKRSTIGYHTFLFASENITIGDDCLIAPFVYFVDSDHGIDRNEKINKQPNTTAPITVGNDVWIASNVTVLKGVTIGDGAVVAANSVVKSNIAPYEIWGGSPAKKIGERE